MFFPTLDLGRSQPLLVKLAPNIQMYPDGPQLQLRCGRIRLPVGLSAAAIRNASSQLAGSYPGAIPARYPPGYPQLSAWISAAIHLDIRRLLPHHVTIT